MNQHTIAEDCNVITSIPFEIRLERALNDLRRGHPIILMDKFDRENEGDLIVAAEKLTVPAMATMIREGSGIVCLCLTDAAIRHLELRPMVENNESRYQTAFTVSIEARNGVSTGVSAQDRVTTIQTAIAEGATAHDLVSPGHVFPLRVVPGGVLEREGHTEGAVELAILAGFKPAAVLCELTNPDGTMTKGEQISVFAEKYKMAVLSIEELVRHRRLLEAEAKKTGERA